MAGATPQAVPISPHASARSSRMASAVSLGAASSGSSVLLDTFSRSRPGIVAERFFITCYGRVAPDLPVSAVLFRLRRGLSSPHGGPAHPTRPGGRGRPRESRIDGDARPRPAKPSGGTRARRRGWRRAVDRTPSGARQAAGSRADRATPRSSLGLPRAVAPRPNGLYDDDAPGAGIVTGIGRIE